MYTSVVDRKWLTLTKEVGMDKIIMKGFDKPEVSRIYVFPNDVRYTLKDVIALHVSDSGTHRLLLKDNTHVIVPIGWIAIELDICTWSY